MSNFRIVKLYRWNLWVKGILLLMLAGCTAVSGAAWDDNTLPTVASTAELAAIQEAATATSSPTGTRTPAQPDAGTPATTVTASRTPKPTVAATETAVPTATPTATPTSLPQIQPTLSISQAPPFLEGIPTPATAVPTAVNTFDVPNNTTNILLLGSDVPLTQEGARTDTMLVVTINREGPTASIISLPRDLYVYVPGKTMTRLNTAYNLGGVELLEQTILYNFGIPINYYARIDFAGFEDIVDALGGVEIAVSCRLQDWRLISPELDPQEEDNWAQFSLEPGVHEMNGDLALWYVRSRRSTSDFDRGRRQQQLLRALLNQSVDVDIISQVPALWSAYQDTVETNMDLGRMLQIAALAPAIRENGVQHLYTVGKTQPWTVPTSGAQVHLPIWEGENKLEETVSRLFLKPALSRSSGPPITVEIINGTGNEEMAALAADNLAWHGFVPIIGEETAVQPTTTIQLYSPNHKGTFSWYLPWVFGQRKSQLELIKDDPNYPYKYQVVLGEDYNPCLNQFTAPREYLSNN